MIVSKDTNPEKDIYYLGAIAIDSLSDFSENEIDYLKLYENINNKAKISTGIFSLILDWLFLVGVINKNNQGNILKCF